MVSSEQCQNISPTLIMSQVSLSLSLFHFQRLFITFYWRKNGNDLCKKVGINWLGVAAAAVHIAYKNKFATIQKSRFLLENRDIKTFFYMPPDHSLLCKIYMYIKRPIFKTLMFLCAIANGASKIAFSHSRSSWNHLPIRFHDIICSIRIRNYKLK